MDHSIYERYSLTKTEIEAALYEYIAKHSGCSIDELLNLSIDRENLTATCQRDQYTRDVKKIDYLIVCVVGVSLDDCLSSVVEMKENSKQYNYYPGCELELTGVHFDEVVITNKGVKDDNSINDFKEIVLPRLKSESDLYFLDTSGDPIGLDIEVLK